MFYSIECGLRAWAQEEDGWLFKSQLLRYKEIATVLRLGFLICGMRMRKVQIDILGLMSGQSAGHRVVTPREHYPFRTDGIWSAKHLERCLAHRRC